MPPPNSPPAAQPKQSDGMQQITKLLSDNHQQTMTMLKTFNEQNQQTVKDLFAMFADRLLPPASAGPSQPSCSKTSSPSVATSSLPAPNTTAQSSAKPSSTRDVIDLDADEIVTAPVIVHTPPKSSTDETSTHKQKGAEKECPPKTKNTDGREKESSSTPRRPRINSVITKVETRPVIRDHRRNLKRKSESEDSDSQKRTKLSVPTSSRALAELSFPKADRKSLENDHQYQRRQFTEALIRPPVWFPMDLSLTAYLVVRFLFVHEKARFHARMHSDKGQNFQQYRKPFHHYGIKAAEMFDAFAHRQHVNIAYSAGPNLKAIIPWFRQWPKQRIPQLTPHCNYFKNQKTVSLRTNVAFFEAHLKKLGGKFFLIQKPLI